MKKFIAVATLLAVLGSAARAQVPATPPLLAPVYGSPITLAQAKKIAAVVTAEAARSNADRYVLAIVQPSGDLVYFEKADNSTYVSIQYAQAKARMAARYRSASGNLPPNAGELPDAIGLTGGMPIIFEGKTIGAIGISGIGGGGDVKLSELAAGALSK
jgi:glc operon protein GlcG